MYPSVCSDVRRRACVHACHVDVRPVNRTLSPVYTIQPVVKPVWQPLVSCKRGISITGRHHAVDLLSLTETWQDADCAVLVCLCGAAYNVVDRARPRTADDLSVNTAVSPFSPVPISRCRRLTFPITERLRSSVHVPVSAVSLRSSSCCTGQARSRCSSRHSLRNWRPCWSALNLTLRLCIVSYHDILWYRSYRIIFPYGGIVPTLVTSGIKST